MPVTVILAVGLDTWLLSAKSAVWRSHGYVVISVATAREAIDHFTGGDFDLVLLGNSIASDSREQLTRLIRRFSSRTPVVCVTDASAERESYADAALPSDSGSLLAGLKEFLASEIGMRARPVAV